MNKRVVFLLLSFGLFLALPAAGRAETFYAYLSGAQEVPPVATTATGYARVAVNEATGTLTFTVVFNGLSSAQTGAHIHAPAAIGATVGVAIDFGTVGGTSGTISGSRSITPTQLAQLRQHQGYVNVHSSNFINGEIRGQLGIKRPVDFDGDGRQDLSILRFPNVAPPGVSQITYWNQNTTSGVQTVAWGDANTDFPTPGDYDGDGRDDLAIYRAGATAGAQSAFWILRSSNATVMYVAWGLSGDQGINRDYDGDGITDVAVFRRGPSLGTQAVWYILNSSNGQSRVVGWGTTGDNVSSGDSPVPGDYDGDGKFDLAVYRFGGLTPNNTFIVLRSSDSAITYQTWGNFQTDFVVPGDYDGDGKFDYAVARTGSPSTTPIVWWIIQSSNGAIRTQTWGISSDRIVQGDYDGDARTDLAVFRGGANATFWIFRSLDGSVNALRWGAAGDFPTATFDAH